MANRIRVLIMSSSECINICVFWTLGVAMHSLWAFRMESVFNSASECSVLKCCHGLPIEIRCLQCRVSVLLASYAQQCLRCKCRQSVCVSFLDIHCSVWEVKIDLESCPGCSLSKCPFALYTILERMTLKTICYSWIVEAVVVLSCLASESLIVPLSKRFGMSFLQINYWGQLGPSLLLTWAETSQIRNIASILEFCVPIM